MKTIEKQAEAFSIESDNGFIVMNNDKRAGFEAGANWMREELTCWRDPKKELPGPMEEVLIKCLGDSYAVDFYVPELGCFFIENTTYAKVIGWREIHETKEHEIDD